MNINPIYSIPFWNSEYPEFEQHQEMFLDAVLKFKENNTSVHKTNISGYQSPASIHRVPELQPLFQHICEMAYQAISDLDFIDCDIALTSAWLNVNDSRQCMISEHIHKEILTGSFYLKFPPESAKLTIRNLGMNSMWRGLDLVKEKNQFTGETIKIEPEEGNIFLFPSYLPHSVETNDHDEERISISFNIIALPTGSIPQTESTLST